MMANFVTIFCQMLDKYKPCMQESLGKAAFKAITQGYAVDYVKFSEHQMQRFGRLLTQMFNTEWEKAVNRNAEEETILIHTINWAPLTHYLKIYRKDQEKKKLLDEVCVGRIVQVVTLIENRFQLICDGNITLSDLNLLSTKDKKFEELAQLVYSEKELPAGYIPKVLQVRQKEMQAFHIQAEQMTVLTSLCQHLENVDRTEVDDVLKKTGNGAKACKVSDFCVPAVVKKVENIENFQPKLCAFDVSQPVLEMLPELQKCNESSVFFSLWGDCCRELRNQCTTLEDVSKRVWQPVRTMWLQIAGLIVTGDINFKDFEKQIGKTFKDNYGQMEVELRTMRIPERKIKQRLDQLKKYRQLETCVKGAKTILKFAREYGLKGDFHQIEVIAQHTENVMEMKSFNDKVMKACDSLKDIEPAKEQCLNTFVRCEQLVKWLQESMKKSGLKELKVFVDLAFMSAGDEPINIARVQCLHSAVTGYAPLIFDLDENCDYKQLLHHCAVVWKDLEANPNLPQQLIDTSRQLQWLKQIKKAHGSVEVTSLMQAEAINANGIFTVGKNAWKKDDRAQKTDNTLLVVADTLKLTVPENEIKRELRNYTFFQLQDLQSRLMLVAGKAGKGNESVDRFTMIFDSITRLSTVYLKLCSSGCVLFKDWTAKFLCNPDRPVCAILEFGHGEGVPQLKGRGSTSEDLKDIIRELANFMENCLEEWLKHIKEKRKSYLHLNYYTVDQLVILQRELVKMGTELEPSHLVYPLLCAVKEDCTPDDLLEAMTAAKEEITVDTNMEDEDTGDSESDDGEMPVYATEDEKKANFVQELVQAGYEEALAMKAFEFVEDKEDVSAGIVWCMDHDDIVMSDDHDRTETENIEPVDEKLTQRPTFSGWSQSQTDIQTMITTNISGLKKQKDDGSAPLIGDLKALWKQFLESITSNIRDYLSLEHLGLILNHLARK
ncbi:E3 ubiquitin-protein ligase rnf213-alpha-like, partial [Mercenaria mercenaria]|uniref:E3 ubiquitin-protein ligase rnf213-alpha-like n=1 Tax=Mercenaria mercenaria TaxID=6596 RepID=UPI00234F9F4B